MEKRTMIQFDAAVTDYLATTEYISHNVVTEDLKQISDDGFYKIAYEVKSPKVLKPIKEPTILAPKTDYIIPVIKSLTDSLNKGEPEEVSKSVNYINNDLQTVGNLKYLDASLTDALFNVVKKDTSTMKKPTREQLRLRKKLKAGKKMKPAQFELATKLSEKELAECNKVSALYTIAAIQNVLYSELTKRTDLKPKLDDMPAYSRLSDILLNTTDANLKNAAAVALATMDRADFHEDIKSLLIKSGMLDNVRKYLKY